VEDNTALVGQRVLQWRLSPRPGVAVGREHGGRRGHAFRDRGCWHATPNRRPPHTVSLNRLPLRSFRRLPPPNLILATFGEQLPGIVAGDRRTADVVGQNLDAAAVELDQPAGCRRRQVSNSRWLNGMRSDGTKRPAWCFREWVWCGTLSFSDQSRIEFGGATQADVFTGRKE
jgi:hypothetical protein